MAMVLIIGLYQQPMRSLSRMSGGAICWGQLKGLIQMFNGRFFNGLAMVINEGKKRKMTIINKSSMGISQK
jgi:hypothetical protein